MLQHRVKSIGKILLLAPQQIEPSPFQARTNFDQQEIARQADA